jgi:ribosome-associated toxin RatA of RatAB toxin-antitoxin module
MLRAAAHPARRLAGAVASRSNLLSATPALTARGQRLHTLARIASLRSEADSASSLQSRCCVSAVPISSPRRTLFGLGKPERVTLHERRLVPFPASVYFDVVLDVDQYHEFVPFCSGSRVTRRIGPNQMEAELTIGFRIFTEKYTSRIDYERPKTIRIKSVQSSVFGHLISTWNFKPNPANAKECYVEFDVRMLADAGTFLRSCVAADSSPFSVCACPD